MGAKMKTTADLSAMRRLDPPGEDFFASLRENDRTMNVWNRFYLWVIKTYGIGEYRGIHGDIYAGPGLMKVLREYERKRLKTVKGLRGKDLTRAVNWSDLDCGPLETGDRSDPFALYHKSDCK